MNWRLVSVPAWLDSIAKPNKYCDSRIRFIDVLRELDTSVNAALFYSNLSDLCKCVTNRLLPSQDQSVLLAQILAVTV